MTTRATAFECEVIGGDVPSDELLELLANLLLDLVDALAGLANSLTLRSNTGLPTESDL